MNLQDIVSRVELKRRLMKFGEAIARLLRVLGRPPEAPIKRRPF
jgi:hypothetical protein